MCVRWKLSHLKNTTLTLLGLTILGLNDLVEAAPPRVSPWPPGGHAGQMAFTPRHVVGKRERKEKTAWFVLNWPHWRWSKSDYDGAASGGRVFLL